MKEHAGALKLDTTMFNKCLDSGEKAEGVKKQLDGGVGARNGRAQGAPNASIGHKL